MITHVRKNYDKLSVQEWTQDECLHWHFNFGTYEPSMDNCELVVLKESVLLLQARQGG